MKPKVFLGSSVEGLSIAFAIQTNLSHDAEITVWSQGIFELSTTTFESLLETIEKVDFAVFVFTPDDIVKIREKTGSKVRDNVLFEFGLFLGKLGKNRVFYVIPENSDLLLPTDLLGLTPGKYEISREDQNWTAATGPASHQIRLMIQKHGLLNPIEETSTTPEIIEIKKDIPGSWYDDFMAKRYSEAVEKIDIEINKLTAVDRIIDFKLLRALCLYKIDGKNVAYFENIISDHPNESYAYSNVASALLWEDYIDTANKIVKSGIEKFGLSPKFITVLASCFIKNGEKDLAEKTFENELTFTDVEAIIEYCGLYIDDEEYLTARKIIHKGYLKHPNNKSIWEKYANIASELNLPKIALYFYDKLLKADADNISYHGYIGNACLKLDLNDISLSEYQKANEMANGTQGWLLSNIGNLLKNKGLYSESIKYFKNSIEINEKSDYAHERMSSALKSIEEEKKEYKTIIKEALIMLKEFSASLLA